MEVSEGLKLIRTKRRPASARLKSRSSYRKNKVKIKRARKIKRRKPAFKRKQQRIKKMKGNKKAGPRRRFVLTSLDKVSNLSESMIHVGAFDLRSRHQQIAALESAINLADVLAEAIEDYDADMEDEENEFDDVVDSEEEDKCKCDDEDEDEESEDEEDDEDMNADDLKIIKTESQDILANLKSDKITPQDAQKIVMDIVKYLGAALKAFSETEELQHVGSGMPKEDPKFSVDDDKSKKKLVGKDEPEGQSHSPQVQKGFGKATVGDKSLDSKQVAPVKDTATKIYVGDKPAQDKNFRVPGPSLIYSYVGTKIKESNSRHLDESMYVFNAAVKWANGELEGFCGSALDSKTAKQRALDKADRKSKHLEKNKEKAEMAQYKVLSASEFAALGSKEKRMLQDDWKLSAKSMDESKSVPQKTATSKLHEAIEILKALNKRGEDVK